MNGITSTHKYLRVLLSFFKKVDLQVLAGENLQRVYNPLQVFTHKYRSCEGRLATTRKSMFATTAEGCFHCRPGSEGEWFYPMVQPFMNYNIFGALWWQVSQSVTYRCQRPERPPLADMLDF